MVSCAMMHMAKSIGGFAIVNDMNLCVSGQQTAE